mmetsp:Transcript_9838/g.39845  ORF Transcript_9838/g.39845 Transcript_9838/m.39845 type:complete len:200 (-) Transcript_9838:970-1569(-)
MTEVLAHAFCVSLRPSASIWASNQTVSSTRWLGSGAADLPLVRLYSAIWREMSPWSSFALARSCAMSMATDPVSSAESDSAAALAAAFSPSLSPPFFLFAGSATAASFAAFACLDALSVAAAALSSPTASSLHRGQAHSNPQRLATPERSGLGMVTSKYFMNTSSPATRSRAARMNMVCPTISLHALGAQLWLRKEGNG